ncbi:MAG: LuxR C-terminal-related transcriptional regulator [Candidatus Berkiella sp.]|jgi:DNA-binding NarL/FixJ family response regulator
MILIATDDGQRAHRWQQYVSAEYTVYELIISDKKTLEICLKKISIDVVLLDKAILGESGIHELSEIHAIQPETRLILMTEIADQREEVASILFGAKAYCEYDINDLMLSRVLRTVLADELWVDRKFVSRLLGEIEGIARAQHTEAQQLDKGLSLLTPRETEIAKLVAGGASNRVIAEALNISERTVKAHLGVIFRKMNIVDRLQLALFINRHQQISSIWHQENDVPSTHSTTSHKEGKKKDT